MCFVPTASADDPQYINRFLVAYGTLGIRPMVLTLWQDAANAVARIAEADLILVGNGATVNALALWKAHGVGKAIKQRYAQGDVVLAGTAAGANVWFEGCVTDSFGDFEPSAAAWAGPGSFCAHFDSEDHRVGVFTDAVSAGDLPGGWAADDGAGVHFTDGAYTESISETAGQQVFSIQPSPTCPRRRVWSLSNSAFACCERLGVQGLPPRRLGQRARKIRPRWTMKFTVVAITKPTNCAPVTPSQAANGG